MTKKTMWFYQLAQNQKNGPFNSEAEAWGEIFAFSNLKQWYPDYDSIKVFQENVQLASTNAEIKPDAPCNRAPRVRPFSKKRTF